MAGKDIIIMSNRELKRLHIIRKVIEKKIKQREAAKILEISDRQVRRVVKRVSEEGDKGISHKRRGKVSNRAIPEKKKEEVLKLYRDKYDDFGPTLFQEKLFEIEKIKMGTQTLRNWLIGKGIWQVKRRRRKHLEWRERKAHFGEMIQVDGSRHDWFEGRGEACVVMGYIDDAKNNVYAKFYEYEGRYSGMDSLTRYIQKYGIPHSLYIDKHSTYKSTAKPSVEDELNERESLSQFERAAKELGVQIIHANSPQAKGRVERLFKTFQDRLIKEMRLKGINSIKEGNKFLRYYLPVFNKRFSIEAREKEDLHRRLPKNFELGRILCIKSERILRNDFTIAYSKKLYQVKSRTNTKKVTVEERLNGRILITYKGKKLKYKRIAQRLVKEKIKKAYRFKVKKPYIPLKEHPWRKFRLPGSLNFKEKEKVFKKVL